MKINWLDAGTVHRATASPPVKLMTLEFGGGQHEQFFHDLGYVLKRGDKWKAHTYGSINPTWMGEEHTDLEEAKQAVMRNVYVGIALNKLTRS